MCQDGRKLFFFLFPVIHHQLQVCVWGICMNLGWVMNSSQPAGTPTTRFISAVSMFVHVICVVFSTCCWGTWMGKRVSKVGIVLKPVGPLMRERRLTVWSVMTPGQVHAGWLLSAVSQKTICWDDSIKVTKLARKPLVITQLATQAGRVQKETMREREGSWKEGENEKHRRGETFRFLPGRGRRVWEVSWTPNWNMRAILSAKLQCVFVFIVWTWHKWDMAGSIVCTTSGVMFSSVFIMQNKVTLNMLTWRKHFQEDKQPPCFSSLPDQTMLPWLSSTLVHSQITMNCQQQLPETTAVKQRCWTAFKSWMQTLWPGAETQPSYNVSARVSVIHLFRAVKPKLT